MQMIVFIEEYQGLYPRIAGKIVTNGQCRSFRELHSIPGLSRQQKDLLKEKLKVALHHSVHKLIMFVDCY
jgi:Photosystem II 12 kDa extrinsic protein (PsbU)